MFGFGRPKPPLTAYQRAELELLFAKCVERVGLDMVKAADVVVDPAFIDIPQGNEEDRLLSIVVRLRSKMNLTDENIQFRVGNAQIMQAAGLYHLGNPALIEIADETLTDPVRAFATVAHEMSHHIFLGRDSTSEANFDERMTDLMPICFGLGAIMSHGALYDRSWSDGTMTGFSMSQMGYLNTQEIGYGLALFARVRSETRPDWHAYLRADSRVTMNKAMSYFQWLGKHNLPLLFDATRIPCHNSSQSELARWIQGDDPTFKIAAIWQATTLGRIQPILGEALLNAASDHRCESAPLVIRLLGNLPANNPVVRGKIEKLMKQSHPEIVKSAVVAASQYGIDLGERLDALQVLFENRSIDIDEVLPIIGDIGPRASRLEATLCRQIVLALNNVHDERADRLLDCLGRISEDPKLAIIQHIRNPEHRDYTMNHPGLRS